jgi:hypothetical protein
LKNRRRRGSRFLRRRREVIMSDNRAHIRSTLCFMHVWYEKINRADIKPGAILVQPVVTQKYTAARNTRGCITAESWS